jgi:hypothetical protein
MKAKEKILEMLIRKTWNAWHGVEVKVQHDKKQLEVEKIILAYHCGMD